MTAGGRAPSPGSPHRLRAVAPPTESQLAWRGRIEAVIRVMRPGLDLMLAAGDRLSRTVEREDLDWTPPRPVSPPAQVSAGPEGSQG